MYRILFILTFIIVSSGIARAQVTTVQFYELADAILDSLRPYAITSVKKGSDGYYYWRNAPTDTPTVRLLLLNRAYSNTASQTLVSANRGSAIYEMLRKYFSAQEISSFRRQLLKANNFTFAQSYLKQDWVQVISQDTLRAIDARISQELRLAAQNQRDGYLLKNYGAWQLFSISGMLFSEDGKKALVEVSFGYGLDVWIYQKTKGEWHKEVAVYSVIE